MARPATHEPARRLAVLEEPMETIGHQSLTRQAEYKSDTIRLLVGGATAISSLVVPVNV